MDFDMQARLIDCVELANITDTFGIRCLCLNLRLKTTTSAEPFLIAMHQLVTVESTSYPIQHSFQKIPSNMNAECYYTGQQQ